MATKNPNRVEFVAGQGFRPKQRAVAFLVLDNQKVNAYDMFEEICKRGGEPRQHILTSFDLWSVFGRNDRRFHGWPNNPEYKDCHTFKWRENRQHHRFYGFTCHPNSSEPSFQLCVLAIHARKNSDDTDFTLLDRVNEWKTKEDIKGMIHTALKRWLAENMKGEKI